MYFFSKHLPSGPIFSKSWFVPMCVCLCVCLSGCSSVCLLTLSYHLNVFLPPIPSWMSSFRDSEFLWKSNGKKSSQIWKLLLIKGVKSPRKNCFVANFALLSRIFLILVFLTLFNGLFAPTSQSPMSKNLDFWSPWGKNNGKKWSLIWKLLLINGVKSPRKKKFFLANFALLERFF